MKNGAFILQYEESLNNVNLLVASSDLDNFFSQMRDLGYPFPQREQMKTALSEGRIFKYCQQKYHVQFIPGLTITGDENFGALNIKIKLITKQ